VTYDCDFYALAKQVTYVACALGARYLYRGCV